MEELHRLHKDVPFGWWVWLQEVIAERARKAAVREQRGGRGPEIRTGHLPDDLHCLSGPH